MDAITLALAKKYTNKSITKAMEMLPKFDVQVVETLPTENISSTTIYLVVEGDSQENNNLYSEYIYINGEWKLLGIQKLGFLNDYIKKDELDSIELITTDDIDEICGQSIQAVDASEVIF